ncbi:MAG TPA: hypothetical protein PK339_02900 [Flavitalea sp.]|nr:hypothetical protein [Flavitalea sp.]
MRYIKAAVSLLFIITCFLPAKSQKISYSEPEREDTKRTNFEIIGKIGKNILVYKNNRNSNHISVYNEEMKLVERVNIDATNNRWINVDFIPYANHCWMIYQFQQKNVLYCMGVKLDENAKRLSDPVELDTTRIGWSADNKIYTTVFSDDKQKIMIFKINSRNQKRFIFSTLLFDEGLQLLEKREMPLDMEERNDYFTNFLLDNEGGLVFGKFIRRGSSDYITSLSLVHKPAGAEAFSIHPLDTQEKVLDEIKIKVDNTNRRYLFTALYYRQRRGNIEGLYTVIWDKDSSSIVRQHTLAFDDDLRRQAKGPDANQKLAFNDYFIQNIIIRKDGGYILVAESLYSSSRGGGPFNRWDYLSWNNPWISPYSYYYSPYYYNSWGNPWNRWGGRQPTRYHAENIIVLSFDKNDTLEWSNVILKTQFDDQGEALLSHQIMNTGGELHFLFNLYERRTLLLNDQSIGPDGKIIRYPTLKNLDKGFEFMPRYGKQVAARTMIMPCQYRNYLTFAKIEF